MAARWGAVFVVMLALLGAGAGLVMGRDGESPLAQADGTSGSGDGTSGDGSSGDGTSGDGTSGDGSSGSSGSGTPLTTVPPRPGTPTTVPPRNPLTTRASGAATTLPARSSTTTVPLPTTARPVRIPQPTTTSSIAPSRVRDGRPVPCNRNVAPGVLCFLVSDGRRVQAIRVPDGQGGFVTLPVEAPAFGDTGDTGGSTTVTNNEVDVQVDVEVQSGEVVRVEPQVDKTTQAVFGTLAALLLVMTASACGALGVRRYWR